MGNIQSKTPICLFCVVPVRVDPPTNGPGPRPLGTKCRAFSDRHTPRVSHTPPARPPERPSSAWATTSSEWHARRAFAHRHRGGASTRRTPRSLRTEKRAAARTATGDDDRPLGPRSACSACSACSAAAYGAQGVGMRSEGDGGRGPPISADARARWVQRACRALRCQPRCSLVVFHPSPCGSALFTLDACSRQDYSTELSP